MYTHILTVCRCAGTLGSVARKNIYLPDDLADEVRRHDLNLSALCQHAVREVLADRTPQKGAPRLDTASAAKIDYLKAQFEAIRKEFDEASQTLSENKARLILTNLQSIKEALEGDRFARL